MRYGISETQVCTPSLITGPFLEPSGFLADATRSKNS